MIHVLIVSKEGKERERGEKERIGACRIHVFDDIYVCP